jgi:hypothetical protein
LILVAATGIGIAASAALAGVFLCLLLGAAGTRFIAASPGGTAGYCESGSGKKSG